MPKRACLVSVLAYLTVTTPGAGAAASDIDLDFDGVESGDDVFLLQVGVSRQPSGNCSCMNWQQVYTQHHVTCGQVFELMPMSSIPNFAQAGQPSVLDPTSSAFSALHASNGGEFCGAFMAMMNNTYAVNMQFMIPLSNRGSFYDRSWCYTSSSCSNLNGGARVNSAVSWKVATPGVDLAVSDLQPPQAEQLAHQSHIDFGMFVTTAGYTQSLGVAFEQANATLVQSARAIGSTVVFINAPDHGHRAMIRGQSTWLQHEDMSNMATTWHLTSIPTEHDGSRVHHLRADPA